MREKVDDRYEYMYRDGLGDGKSIGFYPDGNKKFEIEYKAGVEVNESYEWYATGQTKEYIKYSETSSLSEITRKYAENGVILYEDIFSSSVSDILRIAISHSFIVSTKSSASNKLFLILR